MRTPQHILPVFATFAWAALAIATGSTSLLAQDKPSWTPNMPSMGSEEPVHPNAEKNTSKPGSVDNIKGIGKFKLGQNLTEFPPGLLQVVDPRAHGILLRVSPYGENYLVTDVAGITWGNIPLSGLILTFHSGILIDMQAAMKAKKFDFYAADRAFKAKYGPNDPKTYPVETWKGNQVVMTLIFPNADIKDANSIDSPAEGKIDLFDQGQWDKLRRPARPS